MSNTTEKQQIKDLYRQIMENMYSADLPKGGLQFYHAQSIGVALVLRKIHKVTESELENIEEQSFDKKSTMDIADYTEQHWVGLCIYLDNIIADPNNSHPIRWELAYHLELRGVQKYRCFYEYLYEGGGDHPDLPATPLKYKTLFRRIKDDVSRNLKEQEIINKHKT